jgi:23S rRNA (cytidine2498-2'-O)-methyltransferase
MHAVISAAPRYAALAHAEVAERLPGGAALQALAPGVWLASAPGRFSEFAAALRAAVFVRHACPADREVALPPAGVPGPEVASALLPALRAALPRPPAPPPQLQVRLLPGAPPWSPGALLACLREALSAAGVPTSGARAPFVLSAVVADGRAFVGGAPGAAQLSPWPGGEARLRACPGEVSRAARKLEEALEVFGIPLRPGARALDLGAAPGGWSAHLLAAGLAVTAVDPAALAPAVAAHPALVHLRGSAASVPLPAGPFDLLTADLSWDPLRAVGAAARFRAVLAPGAPGVFTIKFFGRPPLQVVAEARLRLEASGYVVAAVRHLFHDREEATAHLTAAR